MSGTVQALRLGLDLDGVFADFNTSAAYTTGELTGRHLAPFFQGAPGQPYLPTTWNWWKTLGYTRTEIDRFWAHVTTEPTWWLNLPSYAGTGTFFAQLQREIAAHALDVFFLTTRPGYNAHWQCVQWVRDHGIEHPQVAIAANAESKGLLAAGLGLHAYVDDYPPNLIAVRQHAPQVRLGYYRQPWTAEHADTMRDMGAHVLDGLSGLEAFLTQLRSGV